jgi:hypothetical protein
MGVAIFTPGSCNFPGVGQYYKPEIDQAPPVEPPPLADKPAEPIFPEAPEPPADTTDQVALVGYFNALQAYQDDLQIIQDQYRNDMRLYEAQADIYQAEMVDYQKKRLEYETARNAAVEPAEGVIKNVREEFGWAFINKHDPEVFYSWLSSVWAGQAVVIGVYFIIILIMIKRKDS